MTTPVTTNGSRKRQRTYSQRMRAEGFVQVTGWVHRTQAGDATQVLRRLREDPDLRPGPMRNTTTGKLSRLEG